LARELHKLKFTIFALCIHKSLNLKKYCKKIFTLKNFDEKKILTILNLIDPKNNKKILIGSGFAEEITKKNIIANRQNLGNDYETISKIKSGLFFKELEKNNITHPKSTRSRPKSSDWLVKSFASAGGTNIKKIDESKKKLKHDEYYQKFLENGEHLSVQFFCNNNTAFIKSICEQLMSKRTKNPFLIESLITKNVTSDFFKKLKNLVNRVSYIFKLNGLNNIDLVLHKKKIYLIEINPRPGLSMNIISQLSKDFTNYENSKLKKISKELYFSTTILYASKKIFINKDKFKFIKELDSTKNFSELPNIYDKIMPDEPICLLHLKSKQRDLLSEKIEKMSYKVLSHLEKY